MIEPGDLNALQSMMPDKWIVRRISPGGNDQSYWIAANPRTFEGKIFAKADHDKALDYVNEKNKFEKDQADRAEALLDRHHRKGESG